MAWGFFFLKEEDFCLLGTREAALLLEALTIDKDLEASVRGFAASNGSGLVLEAAAGASASEASI